MSSYDTKDNSLLTLVNDESLIERFGNANPTLSRSELIEKIKDAYYKSIKGVDSCSNKPIKTSDHPPCTNCGGIFFFRTGTCHTCITCGESQGCS